VLYQMLTGKLPYSGESPITVALKHVSSPVPEFDPSDGVSPALAAVVRKLLQKAPEDRYHSATEVQSALREARERTLHTTVVSSPFTRRPVTIPNPPPRRRLREGGQVLSTAMTTDAVAVRRAPSWGVWSALALLLIAAAAIGYVLAVRPGGILGPTAVTVPGVTGKPLRDAQRLLAATGLRVAVSSSASETIERGRVLSQDPPAGSHARSDVTVRLTVSSGLPLVSLIDLKSYSRTDAERYLSNAKLGVRFVERYDSAPAGTVLHQTPGAGTIPLHGLVTLVVSKGPPPVTVPSVVTLALDAASVLLKRSGLRVAVVDRVASDNIPANVVASQDPEPGTSIDSGSTVNVVVSMGPAGVVVPNVGGRSVADASAALSAAGLLPRYRYAFEPGDPVGAVIDVSPPAGTPAKHGSAVVLTVVVSGIVPNVTGMTLDDAKSALQNAGYRVGNVAYTQVGPEGRVASTEPRAGTSLDPGETVLIYYNDGSGGPPAASPASAQPTVVATPSAAPT
ncbi:MAG: PASTA domain-containing protein, partial [Candidatus Eremiobacteraeota bacterium]|nr:PASTA domain-containing protein [Candidatus Eremiobacteraeota bacterium]